MVSLFIARCYAKTFHFFNLISTSQQYFLTQILHTSVGCKILPPINAQISITWVSNLFSLLDVQHLYQFPVCEFFGYLHMGLDLAHSWDFLQVSFSCPKTCLTQATCC